MRKLGYLRGPFLGSRIFFKSFPQGEENTWSEIYSLGAIYPLGIPDVLPKGFLAREKIGQVSYILRLKTFEQYRYKDITGLIMRGGLGYKLRFEVVSTPLEMIQVQK